MTEGVLVLSPSLVRVGSTLQVKLGVIFEDTGLSDISLVVGILLLLLGCTKLRVLLRGHTLRDVRLAGDAADFQLQQELFWKIEKVGAMSNKKN